MSSGATKRHAVGDEDESGKALSDNTSNEEPAKKASKSCEDTKELGTGDSNPVSDKGQCSAKGETNDVKDSENAQEDQNETGKEIDKGEDETDKQAVECQSSLEKSQSKPKEQSVNEQKTVLKNFVNPDDLTADVGDLIEIQRGLYSHWGLYVGDGLMIHVTGPDGEISAKEAEVQKKTVKEVAGTDEFHNKITIRK